MATLYERPESRYWQILTRYGTRKTSECLVETGDKEQNKLNKEKAQEYADYLENQEWRIQNLRDYSSLPFADAVKEYRRLAGDSLGRREADALTWLIDTPAPEGAQLGKRTLGEIADWDALSKLQTLMDAQGWSKNSTNRVMSVVSAVLHCNPKWFSTRVRIPLHDIKRTERPVVLAERIPEVCRHLARHQQLQVMFATLTLLRMSAMLSLRWGEVYLDHRWAVIRPEYQKNNKPFGFALTDAHIDILKELKRLQQEQLEQYIEVGSRKGTGARQGPKVAAHRSKRLAQWDSEHVFTWYGRQIKDCNTAAFKEALRLASFPPKFNWHSWRHVGATLARLAGLSLPDLQALGGWESIASVQRYAHIVPQSMAPAAQKLAGMLPSLADISNMRERNGRRLSGGASEDRTRDLFIANEALSQLSYSPTSAVGSNRVPATDIHISHTELQTRAEKDPEIAKLLNELARKLSRENVALRTRATTLQSVPPVKAIKHLAGTPPPPSGTQRLKKAGSGG